MKSVKNGIVSVLKNTLCSPALLVFAIIAGIAGIVREICYTIRDGYDGERMTLVWLIPIEMFLTVGSIALAHRLLDFSYNIYHLGAAIFWIGFIALYSLIKAGFKRSAASKEGNMLWIYFGDVVPLFVISADTVIFLILGFAV